jgi:hypothetical protein
MEVAEHGIQHSTAKEQAHLMAVRKNTRKKSGEPKGKRGRKTPPANETRREAFLRIANYRTTNALYDIRLLGNLARGAYEWSMEDVTRIEGALKKQIVLLIEEFKKATETPVKTDVVEFSLTDDN